MNIYRKIINTKPKYPDGFDNRCKSLVKHLLRRDLSKRFGNLKNGGTVTVKLTEDSNGLVLESVGEALVTLWNT